MARATEPNAMVVVATWPQSRNVVISQDVFDDFSTYHSSVQGLELSEDTEVLEETEPSEETPLLEENKAAVEVVKAPNNSNYVPESATQGDHASVDLTSPRPLQYLIQNQGSNNEYDIRVGVQIIEPRLPSTDKPHLNIRPERSIPGAVQTIDDISSNTMRLFDLVGMQRPFSDSYRDQLLQAINHALHGIDQALHSMSNRGNKAELTLCRDKCRIAQEIVQHFKEERLELHINPGILRPATKYWLDNVKYTTFEESHLVLKSKNKHGELEETYRMPYPDIGQGKRFYFSYPSDCLIFFHR
ncbi:hypothetical protein NPX13_g10553 [Xylaria arbuscula]|uniref:Uncharacterized protein n=1 Tax=Xylaria arbuscula TaxID=114810 RepID=A0A9W8N4I5_9PEZI|nr:hypothetical protein NPX13_g10553 [Xylaria arbuscula]